MNNKSSLEVATLVLAFNRPDYLRALLKNISQNNLKEVYLAVDGPRVGNQTDIQAAEEIKSLADESWPFTLKTLFREKNLGCRDNVSSAIDWFFTHETEGIILEDDCVPDRTFFHYAVELLERYRKNHDVMHISGSSLIKNHESTLSYDFVSQPLCWGWATWRRAWQKYDVTMSDWPEEKNKKPSLIPFEHSNSRNFWLSIFDRMYKQEVDTWDYQWVYTIWKNKGKCILPSSNLVTNIGYDSRATHTKIKFLSPQTPTVKPLSFPLTHPKRIALNYNANTLLQNALNGSQLQKVIRFVIQLIRKV